jgi:hypothetical protein
MLLCRHISHTTDVLLFKFRCNIFIGVRIIKKMPDSVAGGTLCIIKEMPGSVAGGTPCIIKEMPGSVAGGTSCIIRPTSYLVSHDLFCLTTAVCHFPLLFRRVCGLLDE